MALIVACGPRLVAQVTALSGACEPRPLYDACGGSEELLKKYLSASPCVFVSGQASIQSTYSGPNVPRDFASANGHTSTVVTASHAFGYPGVLLNVGVTPTSQFRSSFPSFSQPVENVRGTGTAYSRAFTIVVNYLIGRSELPPL